MFASRSRGHPATPASDAWFSICETVGSAHWAGGEHQLKRLRPPRARWSEWPFEKLLGQWPHSAAEAQVHGEVVGIVMEALASQEAVQRVGGRACGVLGQVHRWCIGGACRADRSCRRARSMCRGALGWRFVSAEWQVIRGRSASPLGWAPRGLREIPRLARSSGIPRASRKCWRRSADSGRQRRLHMTLSLLSVRMPGRPTMSTGKRSCAIWSG